MEKYKLPLRGIHVKVIIFIFLILVLMGHIARCINKRRVNRKNHMYCYFEYEYNGELGTSRDYGPMLELDAVGAMNYRQATGHTITFEKYSPSIEEIHELIDMRQFMHNKRKERSKYNGSNQ